MPLFFIISISCCWNNWVKNFELEANYPFLKSFRSIDFLSHVILYFVIDSELKQGSSWIQYRNWKESLFRCYSMLWSLMRINILHSYWCHGISFLPQVMQAALMAQAALVRGQVQAQAAFMLNQMNMRQQNPSSASNSKLPNTMINSKGDLQQMQGTGNSGLGEPFVNICQINCIWEPFNVLQMVFLSQIKSIWFPKKVNYSCEPKNGTLPRRNLENETSLESFL